MMIVWFQGAVLRDLGKAHSVWSLSLRAKAEDQRLVNVVGCCGHHWEWFTR